MKTWNFTFTDTRDGGWGWNSVKARGKKSAINKANKRIRGFSEFFVLDVASVNDNMGTYDMLMRSFY
jgi:hypothetical protein